MDEKDIVKVDGFALGSLQVQQEQVIQKATAIAQSLKGVIEAQKLFAVIQGKKFVTVEGWTTLGALLGVTPREVETKRLDDGSYESTVELVNAFDRIIGKASATVGMDETWGKRQEYARRSMAQTRATGKAFRLCFSWIIKLAGYEACPAEEMIDAEYHEVAKVANPEKPPVGKGVMAKESWQTMSREDAENTLAHDGVRYGDIEQKDLDNRVFGINKKLKLVDLPEAERQELQSKLDAINALRYFRAKDKENK